MPEDITLTVDEAWQYLSDNGLLPPHGSLRREVLLRSLFNLCYHSSERRRAQDKDESDVPF